jgi:hypothetical protein
MSYETEKQKHDLDINQALSIDLGTADNLAACVDLDLSGISSGDLIAPLKIRFWSLQ